MPTSRCLLGTTCIAWHSGQWKSKTKERLITQSCGFAALLSLLDQSEHQLACFAQSCGFATLSFGPPHLTRTFSYAGYQGIGLIAGDQKGFIPTAGGQVGLISIAGCQVGFVLTTGG